ncbi:MAG: 4-alpha-glucanotransferase [Epulopiscium sp. Nele67-Bin005]|nr:MAG: 4-alpha-glucanotransferase [Epulopiscium sp. Nele67-Bin005]
MPISSLASPYGIGTFGDKAYEFANFLKDAGQTYWQILPLGHTSYGDSPYQAFSAFAGNPYFIDFEVLERDGLLNHDDFAHRNFGHDPERVDYGAIYNERYEVLAIAFNNFKNHSQDEFNIFKEQSGWWLKDYALFMAIKEKMQSKGWKEWDEDLKLRRREALSNAREELKERISFWEFVQFQFFKQWNYLKSYVNKLGIEIIGDIPIYVAEDSSDAWANSEIFLLDESKNPTVVAGCPPDAFSETGQLWGNPIYNWEYLESTGYSWWITRVRESLKLFDVIRVDHFRGFEAYWTVPYGEETAINGEWVKGPGIKLFNAIKNELGDVNIIAEDLGYLTQDVLDFLAETKFPGMKVLQFAFDSREESDYIPHTYEKNCIVYTGTHDNDTVMGWIDETGNPDDVAHAKNYLRLNEEEGLHWGFIRGAWASVGYVALAQMQDFLALGNESRINLPSSSEGNWQWRIKPDAINNDLSQQIYKLTKLYGRFQ